MKKERVEELKKSINRICQLFTLIIIMAVVILWGLLRYNVIKPTQADTKPIAQISEAYNMQKKIIDKYEYMCFLRK